MYHVELGDLNGNNKVLYYPTDEKCVALEPVLKRKVGDCGEFNIKIPVSNVLYSQISELKIITIYRNNKEKWRGYIKEITTSFNKTLNLYCIEDMGWLNYEFLTPESKKVRRDVQLQALINAYNNQNGIAGTAKVFEVGTVSSGASTEITYETTYEDSILDCLRIVAGSDRYVKVRRENGKRYIDIASLATYGKRSSQSIELGSNMLDYVKELNTGYMLNVIYPYGDEEEGKELYSGVMSRLKGTPLVNNESIAKYGRIAKNIIFSTSDLNTLNENASAYLNRNKDPRLSMDLTAVDMADLGVDTDDFELGDEIHTLATPFGIDQYIYITEQSINIQSVTKNKYKLSSTVSSNGLASQTATISAELQKIPTKASILETALSNAVNLLSAAKGGYVAYKFNDAGQPTEISIQNSLNNNQVTKKWVWNENGFGYMYKENSEWKTNVAITMDGSIVADYITSGTLNSERIKASVIGAINNSTEGLTIEASKININGAVTFNDFSQETQNRITTVESAASSAASAASSAATTANSAIDANNTLKKQLAWGSTKINGGCIKSGRIDLFTTDDWQSAYLYCFTASKYTQGRSTVSPNTNSEWGWWGKTDEGAGVIDIFVESAESENPNAYAELYLCDYNSDEAKEKIDTITLTKGHNTFGYFNWWPGSKMYRTNIVNKGTANIVCQGFYCTYHTRIDSTGLHTTNGHFTGEITASTISGNTISGGTISGTTMSGNTISGGSIKQGNTTSSSADFVDISDGIIKCRKIQSNSNDRDSKLLFPEGARFQDVVWFQGGTYSARITCGGIGEDWEYHYAQNYPTFAKLRQNGDESASYFVPFFAGSDRRLKSNITPITNAKDFINRLEPCHYNYCDNKRTSFGLIAQDVKDVLEYYNFDSNLVGYDDEDDMYMLDYVQFHGWEIAGIKELYSEVDLLKEEIVLLKEEIKTLKGDK